jgi:hypothetical protein
LALLAGRQQTGALAPSHLARTLAHGLDLVAESRRSVVRLSAAMMLFALAVRGQRAN